MAPSQSAQLESIIEEVLKNGNVRPLDVFLERDINKGTPVQCTRKLLTKLDKLVTMSLDRKDARTASSGLAIISKCGKNLNLTDGQGLSCFISHGLITKWFKKCQLLWVQHGPRWDQTMFNLSENFLNALMVVHESCKEGTYKVTESFLYPVGQLAVNPTIYILIQKEAIRKFNLILDKIPAELKKNKKILTSQEASDIMIKLAAQILEGGDYDLQSSLMEALCRMATPEQRKKFADRWFGMAHVASAFSQISDSEFETACRRFLNMVNGMQGDRRRVCSYPCLEVYLGNFELLMPSDEKLEEFWIDFNLGSHSISFYFSLPDEEESHWETICICENEVQSYTVREERKNQILQIKLSEVVVVGAVEGSSLAIRFSSSLDILQAAQNVYGHIKNNCTPVVKKAGKTQRSGTQVVPESQVSLGEAEKNTPPCVLSAQTGPGQTATPGKIRMSKSTVYISSSGKGTVHSISSLVLKPSTRDKDRTFLGKDCTPSGSTTKREMQVAEAKHAVVTGEEEETSQDHYFVPDTQPRTGRTVSSWSKLSVSEMLMMPTQKIGSLPSPELHSSVLGQTERGRSSAQKVSVSESSIVLQKQLHSELTQRLQQVLDQRNKDPQYLETSALQKKTKSSTENLKERISRNVAGPLLCTPKIHQVQRNTCATGESKGQLALEADTVLAKPSAKISTAKTVQDKQESKVKDDSKMALKIKEKRETEITGSMMKIISNRYENTTRTPTKDTAENTQNWVPPSGNRSVFNMTMFSLSKKEIQTTVSQRKSLNKSTKNSVKQSKDVFAFNMDSPVHIGAKNKILNKTFDTSNSGTHSSPPRLNTNKKAKIELVANNKRYVKKHLFSDTDTDATLTEVSWLRESARRSKPEITKYPRQALVKPKAAHPQAHFADESCDFLPSAQKAAQARKKPSKKALDQPKMVKQTAVLNRPHAAGRRPKRTAATSTKSYREPDTDSQSETEGPPALKCSSTDNMKNTEKTEDATPTKKEMTVSKQSIKMKLQSLKSKIQLQRGGQQENSEEMCLEIPQVKKRKNNQPAENYREQDGSTLQDLKKKPDLKQVVPENDPQETVKMNEKNVFPAQEQLSALKDSLAACQTSFCPSPPSTEKMRSAERSAPTLDLTCSTVLTPQGSPLPASPKPPHQETPSPIPLLPKPLSKVSSKGKGKVMSFYKAEKNHSLSKTQSIQSVPSPCSLEGQSPTHSLPTGPSAEEMCTIQQHLSSAAQSPLFPSTQPLLTSTLCELNCPSPSPLPEDTASQGCDLDFSKVSSVSLALYRRSSVHSGKSKDSSTGVMTESSKSERTPVTDRDLELTQPHVSGPSRKRHVSSVSNSEEDEKEEKKSKIRGQRSPRMKPRKLFKSFAEVSTVDELSQISSANWEVEGLDGDKGINLDVEVTGTVLNPSDLVDQLSSDMKNKFQKRYKTMESYNKQTLKTVQQYVSSISTQLSKFRTQKLEQVQKVLLEEIHSMEEDNNMLKNMEKDLNVHWKKQMVAFRSYQKQEIKRNDTLKRTLNINAYQSLESEEEIVTSKMEVLRKEMKSVQDRLLSEMLEGEIQGVKKGLQALFFP